MEKYIKRQTEISIETHDIKIIRILGDLNRTFCERCRVETWCLTPEQIAAFLRISIGEVFEYTESGVFHLTGSGARLVCGESLKP